jgi:3-methyl-2-oxobutanoate hydroxymethyltransferase
VTQSISPKDFSAYGSFPPDSPMVKRKAINLPRLAQMHASGEKITMLTAYDATFAAMAEVAGVDCLLVGDSLGMVSQGRESTLGVTLEDICYHTQCVSRGLRRSQGGAWLIADLPFGTYQESRDQAIRSASALMRAGAHMVKLEGGGWTSETVAFLVERGIPVCAHLGLTPQTVFALGGYRVQGKDADSAKILLDHAKSLEAAGASMLVLEMVPQLLASQITLELSKCATIGIGAGSGTSGQVLVMHDMLGMNLGKMPKFVRNFMLGQDGILSAMKAYVLAVKEGSFPDNQVHAW